MGHRDNNYVDTGSAAITTSCENVEMVARLLDYGYSEAGSNLFNFGSENVSYTLVDGSPVYTDLILNNSEGLSVAQAMAGYARACYSGPFVQSEAYSEQYYATQEQKDAAVIWADTNMAKHMIPPITSTAEESQEIAIYLTDITAYRDRETMKFITGERSFDEWDDYVAAIDGMGLSKVLELKEAAIARYNNR